MDRDDVSAQTWLVSAGRPTAPGQPLNTPIIGASTYMIGGERVYSRNESTEGWEAFEAVLGGLEGGEAVVYSSGMAACAAVLNQYAAGSRIVIPDDCYQGVAALVSEKSRGLSVERLAATDPRWTDRAGTADLLWLESPTNPLLDVADLEAICAAPRGSQTTVVVDNTFATPLLQRPLAFGADVVVHSATKLIGGHSDLLLGAVVTADDSRLADLRRARSLQGATPGMLECFLALRGIRTLGLRLRQAEDSAKWLVDKLSTDPAVVRVRYPGFGTMISFELEDADAADNACRSVNIIRHATSLGGVESSMERRNALPGQEHIPAGLVRLSVGCEGVEDLWTDLEAAIRSAKE